MPIHKPRTAALVVFARWPERGRVKTRLVPPLTPEQALGLHVACLESTARLAASLPASIDKWLYFTPPSGGASARARASGLRFPRVLRVRVQRGRDLGARLQSAFAELWGKGYRRVVVIGTDSPALTRRRLRRAFAALRRADAVLGPARDGGYYLIGLRATSEKLPSLFRGVAWGTRRALRQTQARLRRAGLRCALLPLGYDVDVVADLARLRGDLRRDPRAHLEPLRHWFAAQR